MNLAKRIGLARTGKTSVKKAPRTCERVAVQRLRWQFGEVIDVSESGMCVRVAMGAIPAISSLQRFTLRSGSGSVELLGRIMWLGNQRRGSGSIHAGIQFVDLSKEQAAAVVHTLRHGQLPTPSEPAKAPGVIAADIEVPDLYAVLGVARDVTAEDLRAAFRALARRLHPDRSPDPASGERFTLIHKSYSALKDPEKRRRYDALLSRRAA